MLKLIVEVSGDEVERVLDMLGALDELMEFVKHKHTCCGRCHKHDD